MKNKGFYALIMLFCATKIMAQDGNARRWQAYVSNLTSLNVSYDVKNDEAARNILKNSELERESGCTVSNIYENPLTLNDKSLNLTKFGLMNKGILKVVKGEPETPAAKAIPFYVYIRRNGKILEDTKMPFYDKKLTEIALSDIFPFCQNGDELIIKPANSEDWRAKRILKILTGC